MNNKPIYSPFFSRISQKNDNYDVIPDTTNPISRKNRLAVTTDVTKNVSEIINKPEFHNEISASQNVYPKREDVPRKMKEYKDVAFDETPDMSHMTPTNVKYYKHMRKHYGSFFRLNQPKLQELYSASNTLVKNNENDEKIQKLEKQLEDTKQSVKYINSILERIDNNNFRLEHRKREKSFVPYGGNFNELLDGNYK